MFLSKQKSQVCYSKFKLIGILTGKHWDLARKLEKKFREKSKQYFGEKSRKNGKLYDP